MGRLSALQIWITRAQPGADLTAERLRALGHDPLAAPVLRVHRLDIGPPDLTQVRAIAFTSANAVRSFAALVPADAVLRRLPVFAVGDATAAQAGEHGFTSVVSADGDVAALGRAILERRDEIGGVILHPCGLEVAGDLAARLAHSGVGVRAYPLYETVGVDETPGAAAKALEAGTLDLVMVHSPKAAKVLKRLLDIAPRAASERLRLAVLSQACADPLAELGFASIALASVPREDVLLRELIG